MSARSSNMPVSGLVLLEKANDLAKRLDIANLKASNGWVDRWKTPNNVKWVSRQYQVRKSQANQKWLCPGRKLIYQPYCQDIDYRIPLTLMSLVFSLKHYQTKLWNWKIKNAAVVNTAKSDSPGYAQPVLQVKNYRYRFAWIGGHRSHFFTTKYNISNTTDGSRCFIGSLKVSVGDQEIQCINF